MILKYKEKRLAIKLRKDGFSYSEILKKVPVAKSTLSLWLRSVGLSKSQKQRLTKKKLLAALRGALVRKNQRKTITKKIKKEAIDEIKNISGRDLWMVGTALYWAEGYKEKLHGSLVQLGNSDPYLISIFLKWLYEICKIPKSEINFRIHIHETARHKLKKVQQHWSKTTGFPIKDFQKITWKKNKIKTNRKNVGKDYFGLLIVSVKKSTNLNRNIQGWIEGICKNCGMVQW